MTPRQFLGQELARARLGAGFKSAQALADHLGYERTVVAKAESGERVPSDPVLTAWTQACGLDTDHYQRLAELARTSDGPVPSWFETWLEAEREAHTLRYWQPLIIPGLFQTESYARTLFLAAGADDTQADDLVKSRLERQVILDSPESPHVVAVLDESVLRRLIGSPQTMAEQLEHLAERASLPQVSVQVVPAGNGANAGLSGGFALASCDGAPDTLRMEAIEDVTAENRTLIRHATVVFDLVRGDALPRGASRTLIMEVANQWKTQ